MNQKEIAIISDIHGNSFALKEVLSDINNKGIINIINLGDSLYGPLDPKGTFEMLLKNKVTSISGNQDRFIIENLNNKTDIDTLEYVKSQLNDDCINWLKSLPFDMIFNDVFYCCHASPNCDSTYLLEELHPNYVCVKEKQELIDLIKDIKQNIIACGHSHVHRIVKVEETTIINSGSVGLPAYDDDLPIFHKMENFSPQTNYSIAQLSENGVRVNQVSLTYDYEKAAKLAEYNNRNDWACWIKTGRV
jgi:predicted phosphodiesterase